MDVTALRRWPAAVAVAVGVAVSALIVAAGLEWTTDSLEYLSAATSGAGIDGGPFVKWPPLFPALLAPAPHLVAAIVNPLAAGAIVAGAIVATSRITPRRDLQIIAGMAVAVSWPLTYTYGFVWSEPVFTALVVWFLVALHDRHIPAAAALAAAASLTRYTGVVALFVLAVVLLRDRRQVRGWWLWIAVAAAPLGLWLARNLLVAGYLTGNPSPDRVPNSWAVNTLDTAMHLGSWILPGIAVAGLVWLAAAALARSHMAQMAGLFFLAFTAVTIVGTSVRFANHVGPRLLAPLFPIAVLLAVDVARRVRRETVGVGLVALVVAAQLVSPVVMGQPTLWDWITQGSFDGADLAG